MLIADNNELVHLVVTIDNEKLEAKENTDTVSGLKEFQRRSQALC